MLVGIAKQTASVLESFSHNPIEGYEEKNVQKKSDEEKLICQRWFICE